MDDYEYGEPDSDYGPGPSSEPPREVSRKRSTEREDKVSCNFNRYLIDLYNKS